MKPLNDTAPRHLAAFQQEWGRHLRSPSAETLPAGLDARRSRAYETLLFTNLCGFLNSAFPVARRYLGEAVWRDYCRQFFRDWRAKTPYFSQIAFEFVQYWQSPMAPSGPEWLPSLLDYEWVELELDTCNARLLASARVASQAVGADTPLLASPLLRLRHYAWAVQCIKPGEPVLPASCFLAIYRDASHKVIFVELNALCMALLELFQQQPLSPAAACGALADLLPQGDAERLLLDAMPLITDWQRQGLLVLTPEG
jgi:uncharacterized protein